MKKILLLAIALITFLTGCAGPIVSNASEALIQDDQQKASSDISKPIEISQDDLYANKEDMLSFTDADGKAAYSIVYPENTIEIIHDAAEVLRVALKEATGKDFKKHSDATPDADNACEILIGNTNRSQSKNTLKEKEYSIKVDGNKIVISGGSYYATATAVSEFKNLFSKNA